MEDAQGNPLELGKFYEAYNLGREIPGPLLLKRFDDWGYCFEGFREGKLITMSYPGVAIDPLKRYSDTEINEMVEGKRAHASWIERSSQGSTEVRTGAPPKEHRKDRLPKIIGTNLLGSSF